MGAFMVNPGQPNFQNLHRISKAITFDGSAGGGAVGTVVVFTPQSFVIIREIIAVVGGAGLTAGAGATLSLGVTGAPTAFNAATLAANMGAGVAGGYWKAGAVANFGALPSAQTNYLVNQVTPQLVIITIAVADVTAGSLNITAVWDTAECVPGDIASNFS